MFIQDQILDTFDFEMPSVKLDIYNACWRFVH